MNREELQGFIETTAAILEEDGIEEFLPTIMVRDEIQVIEGIPDSIEDTAAIQNIIRRNNLLESEFAFAVRSGLHEVTVGCLANGKFQFFAIDTANDFRTAPTPQPSWWHLG